MDVYEIKEDVQTIAFICKMLNVPQSVMESIDSSDKLRLLAEDMSTKSLSFKILYNILKDKQFTAVIEEKYVERVYRDSYYTYFSKKHFEYDRYCKRILIFDGSFGSAFLNMTSEELQKCFKGYLVIRPLHSAEIGRSLLDPFYFKKDMGGIYLRKTRYTVSAFGKQLSVEAFPYSMQDGETTTCAEITILNISDYYSQRYPEYHLILPHDIINIAKKLRFERPLPTHGLQYEVISKVFTETGFAPILYHEKTLKPRYLKHILHYYIESGIPVAIGIKTESNQKHSIIAIGHGEFKQGDLGKISYPISDHDSVPLYITNSADIVNQYCVVDDNRSPYEMLTCEETEDGSSLKMGQYILEYLMVPLSKRMVLPAEDAYNVCKRILVNELTGIKRFSALYSSDSAEAESLIGQECIDVVGDKNYPLCIRLFMASSKNFRKMRVNQFLNTESELLDIYSETPFSRFIWVCELYTIDSYPDKAIGEIIIDATSSAVSMTNGIILIHYPKYYFVRKTDFFTYDMERNTQFYEMKKWVPIEPYRENLSCKS